ncbi:hypothetical protein PoB_006817300 [Plakobranchus ocellatus]|uniref:Uncharacterized protein n=1 Tax=Plakobranchus ocellatus TaxID=259542 RepID=A0AAV4DBM8_9GAST|nr:hypothetical protein PoB_006817300 [Plakobranchus ocellatus]
MSWALSPAGATLATEWKCWEWGKKQEKKKKKNLEAEEHIEKAGRDSGVCVEASQAENRQHASFGVFGYLEAPTARTTLGEPPAGVVSLGLIMFSRRQSGWSSFAFLHTYIMPVLTEANISSGPRDMSCSLILFGVFLSSSCQRGSSSPLSDSLPPSFDPEVLDSLRDLQMTSAGNVDDLLCKS